MNKAFIIVNSRIITLKLVIFINMYLTLQLMIINDLD